MLLARDSSCPCSALHLLLMKFAGFGSGKNALVISISLVTSLVYLLRNSYRVILVVCSVPELHHPCLETRSGTRPQSFCHTFMI